SKRISPQELPLVFRHKSIHELLSIHLVQKSYSVKGICSLLKMGLVKVFSSKARLFPMRKLNERSEEHTSELQSRFELVYRLLLEKKKNISYLRRGGCAGSGTGQRRCRRCEEQRPGGSTDYGELLG